MITMMMIKDDDKGDDKKLKDQSKNNSRESKANQRTTQVNQRAIKKTQEESHTLIIRERSMDIWFFFYQPTKNIIKGISSTKKDSRIREPLNT